MLAYDSDEALKQQIVAELCRHAEAERLVPGDYWNDEKKEGCFIGCIIKSSSHADAMNKIGAPLALGHLCDETFEGLCQSSIEEGRNFGVNILDAIPAGSDLSLVPDKIMIWSMNHLLELSPVKDSDDVTKFIADVRNLYQRRLGGDEPTDQEWEKVADLAASGAWGAASGAWGAASGAWGAASGAWGAARYAASAAACDAAGGAAGGAARYAAWDAARGAAWAARDAAWATSAARDAARDARYAFWASLSKEMIKLCHEAPVPYQA